MVLPKFQNNLMFSVLSSPSSTLNGKEQTKISDRSPMQTTLSLSTLLDYNGAVRSSSRWIVKQFRWDRYRSRSLLTRSTACHRRLALEWVRTDVDVFLHDISCTSSSQGRRGERSWTQTTYLLVLTSPSGMRTAVPEIRILQSSFKLYNRLVITHSTLTATVAIYIHINTSSCISNAITSQ